MSLTSTFKSHGRIVLSAGAALALVATAGPRVATQEPGVRLTPIGTYETRIYDAGASEIVEYDPETKRLFVVNARAAGVDVLDATDPARPTKIAFLDASALGGVVNSVDVSRGILGVAIEATVKTNPGKAAFYRTSTLALLGSVPTGAQPDMITFTPDGLFALTANEGEPNDAYTIDPEGSVTIIDLGRQTAATVGFTAANGQEAALRAAGVRIFGPGATAAKDFEPEYIAVDPNGRYAYVVLQENNAIAVLDLTTQAFTRIMPLGYKDHMRAGNGLDPNDRDQTISIQNWPVYGMYQPDGIAAYTANGRTYLVTANEGDSRDYGGFSEEARVSSLNLDPTAFPNAAFLKANGRLTVTTTLGDTDGDGDYDKLYAFGGRSFSIWDTSGNLVWDSGDAIERITAARYPANFNAGNTNNTFEDRSDNKGPEPEGVAIGVVDGRTYAFIGLERMGGVMTWDVSDPHHPVFVDYVNNRNFSGSPTAFTAGDLGPEGVAFIPGPLSPNRVPMLIVGNEISGTTTLYNVNPR
ncbi:MAG: choice-of-anchor I family protein [Vicinamibacterales bacterium]